MSLRSNYRPKQSIPPPVCTTAIPKGVTANFNYIPLTSGPPEWVYQVDYRIEVESGSGSLFTEWDPTDWGPATLQAPAAGQFLTAYPSLVILVKLKLYDSHQNLVAATEAPIG